MKGGCHPGGGRTPLSRVKEPKEEARTQKWKLRGTGTVRNIRSRKDSGKM